MRQSRQIRVPEKTPLENVLEEFEPHQIYNVDETAIFYRIMPERTLEFKGVNCLGAKKSKEQLTALFCSNQNRTDKLPLLIIGKSRYILPLEEFTVIAKIDSGTNALFVLDFENIRELVVVCNGDRFVANTSYFYNETGIHQLNVLVSNYIGQISDTMDVFVMYKPNGFTITQSAPSLLQSTENAVFTIALDNTAQISMNNLTVSFQQSNLCDFIVAESLIISPGNSKNFEYSFLAQGNYTIKVKITNAVGSISNSFDVYVWDKLNVSLHFPIYVVVNEEVNFSLDGHPPFGFQYKIDFGNGIVRANNSEDIFYSTYSPIDLTGIIYTDPGNYTIHLEATNSMYSVVQCIETTAVIPIDGLLIDWGNAVNLIRKPYEVQVNVSKGTNVTVMVKFNEDVYVYNECQYMQAEYIYAAVGKYTVNVVAFNPVSNTSNMFDLEVVYDLNGFTISQEKNILPTTENASFGIHLNETAAVPMGNMSVIITYNDTFYFMCPLIISPRGTQEFPFHFVSQGNHSVTVTVVSTFGTQVSKELDVYVWDFQNSFTITQSTPSLLQSTENAVFTIALDSIAQVSTSNLTVTFQHSNLPDVMVAEALIINPGNSKNFEYSFASQGNYTIEVNITNVLGSISNSFDVYVWDKLNVSLHFPIYVVVNEEVNFSLDGHPPFGFQYKIDFGNGIVRANNSEDIFYSTYSPIDLTGIIYTDPGNYTIHLEATNPMYAVVQDFEITAVIPIDGLLVDWGNAVNLVRKPYEVQVNVSKGTNVTVMVKFNEDVYLYNECQYMQAEYIYTAVGKYTVGVLAVNPVSNESTTFELEVVYDLNGLTISLEQNLLQTTENASFGIHLNETAAVPMGNMSVIITYNDTFYFMCPLIISSRGTQEFPFHFVLQGNHSVTVTVVSIFGTQVSKELDVYVWDVLNVSLSVDHNSFEVGAHPTFQILHPPPSGFLYTINFGESTVLNQRDHSILSDLYNPIIFPLSFKYDVPGQYFITFTAYNDIYMTVQNQLLNIQYRLPDSYLQINPKRTYVIPDDIATFKIFSKSNSTAAKPTNVFCNIDYGDGTVLPDTSTEFDYDDTGFGLLLEHSYATAGTHEFILNCSNLISKLVLSSTILVKEVTADSFSISYSSDSLLFSLMVDLHLYDLTTPPNNVRLEWDFGDGSSPEIDDPMISFAKQHTYTKRGTYSGFVNITYASDTVSKPFDVRIGTFEIKLMTAETIGLVSNKQFDFKLTNYLPGTAATVDVIWGDETTDTYTFDQGQSQKPFNHIFVLGGVFTPQIQATTNKGIENSSLENSIIIQNAVQNLTWTISSNVILLSPFAPKLIYTGNQFLINITCVFNFEDASLTMENINLTTESPEVFSPEFTYLTEKERSISVTCSNLFTSQTLTATILVLSDCFNSGNMFETTYRSVSTPLKALMSSIPVISGRVELTSKCHNSTDLTYTWTVEEQYTSESTGWKKLNVHTPNAKLYNLATSGIGPGTFRLTCNLTIVSSKKKSIEDYMYVELINPPLVAELTGGTRRVWGKNSVISLNAVSNSYDPVIGYGKQNHLSFSWSCYQVNEYDLDSYFAPHSTDTTYRAKPSCNIALSSDGTITVPAGFLPLNVWSLFEANITKDTRAAVAIQVIKIVEVSPPQVALVCKWNCELKKASGARMLYETNVICPDCSSAELASGVYEWTFYKYSGNGYDVVNNTDSHFHSASSAKIFDLDGDFMEPGRSYKLKLKFTVTNIAPGESEVIFSVNEDPYGGFCSVSPTEGTATTDDFTFTCSGWKDEGARNTRDPSQDGSEPLTYAISQMRGNETTLMYSGTESSAIQTLALCPKEDGYRCLIEFRIVDIFKSEAVMVVNITVTNPMPAVQFNTFGSSKTRDQNKTSEAEAVFTAFLDNTVSKMTSVTNSKDPEKAFKVAATLMSAINTMEIEPVTAEDIFDASSGDGSVGNIVADALEQFTKEDPQIAKLLEMTEMIANTMLDSINTLLVQPSQADSSDNSSGEVVSAKPPKPDVLIMLSTSLALVLKKPIVVKPNVVTFDAFSSCYRPKAHS
ncbi:polycystin-1-like [Gigantopelta aegis]|uniref:polycystin-1-like n=1 Tax=Gigantopelta aegis TaxID=1735272 RepID=UPI001B888CE9|nr:polycystin-1-like [Gigantopelta aegis]